VAHSLGGLVCANALSRSNGTDAASDALVQKVIGVAFLGTPFEGSSKAKWGIRGLRLLEWFSTTHKEDVKDLEERSARLISINEAFYKFLKARDRSTTGDYVEIACFFEEYAIYKGKVKIGVIVPKESACLAGIDPQPIHSNHVDMCKFEDEDRENYKSIASKLSQWIANMDRQPDRAGRDGKV
jgi:protein SERAC1